MVQPSLSFVMEKSASVRATADCVQRLTSRWTERSLAGHPKMKRWGSLLGKGIYK